MRPARRVLPHARPPRENASDKTGRGICILRKDRVLRTLKRDRRNQSSQSNGSGTFSPSMLGGRKEAEAWTPPPLPDLPQFRESDGDAPPPTAPPAPPSESKARKTKRSDKPKDMPPLGAMPRAEPLTPPSLPPEPPLAKTRKAAAPKEEPKRFERKKLEIPPEPLDLGPADGPIDGDEPPIIEERPRQPTAATVGALLAQTRSSFGQDIEEVSSALRIRPVFLRAIEESRYQDLPGLTYGVGFVRSYAHYLGLDVNDCVERFKDEAAGIDRTPNLNFPTPVPEAKVPTGAIILVSLLLAGLAYLVWTYVSRDGGFGGSETAVAETAAPESPSAGASEAATTSSGTAATATAAQSTATSGENGASEATGTTDATAAAGTAAGTTAAAAGTDTAAGTPAAGGGEGSANVSISDSAAAAAGGAVAGGAGTVLFTEAASASQPADPSVAGVGAAYSGPRVVLRATQDSWVQVRNASNESIFTRVLRAGDTYDVPDQPGLSLLTGNAGGLVIMVDGQEVPKLGRSGQVRRNVSLSPDSLKAN